MQAETLGLIQTVTGTVTALAIVFAFRQVQLATRQLRKQSDKSATEFVLDAEGQFDGMYEALFAQDPAVIRACYVEEIDSGWSDVDVKKFVFFLRYYGHISRMVYLAGDASLDIGFSSEERSEFLEPWKARLRIFQNDPIMRRIHENAMKFRNYNARMLDLSTDVFGAAHKS